MYLHVDVLARTYDKSLLEENLEYFWKCIQKLFFLQKIKDWSYSLKMAKLLFFSILTYIYVMSKLTQDLILCLKKTINISKKKKLFKDVKNGCFLPINRR